MREVLATVIHSSSTTGVTARVRRAYNDESVAGIRPAEVKRGDKIVVARQRNNPYLVFVRKLHSADSCV